MQHHASAVCQLELIRGGILHRVDHRFVDYTLRRIHFRLAGPDVDVLSGHSDINFTDLRPGFELRGRNGIPHALHHLPGRIPVALRIAIVGNRTRSDDVQPVQAAVLGDHRDDF